MKHPDIIRDGIRYSAYSHRGKQVKREILREKRNRTSVPISIMLTVGLALSSAVYA
jgi:hypothetical protein